MTYSSDTISAALHAAVARKGGDYEYEASEFGQCTYTTPDGAPSCIVGWVVGKVEPDLLKRLNEYEYGNEYHPTSIGADGLTGLNLMARADNDIDDDILFDVTPLTAEALNVAQRVQDDGFPWRYSQEAFDRIIAGEPHRLVYESVIRRGEEERYDAAQARLNELFNG